MKAIFGYHYISRRMARIQNMANTKTSKMYNNRNSHSLVVEIQNGIATLEDTTVSCKVKYKVRR